LAQDRAASGARQQRAAADSGTGDDLAGRLAGDGQTRPPGHQSRREKHRIEEEDKGDSPRSSEGRERRRRSGSRRRGGLRRWRSGDGAVEERRSSSGRCGLERCSGVPFIGGEGREGDAAEAVGRHTSGPPLMAWWGSVRSCFGGKRKGEGWAVPLGAWRTRGEGEEPRGGEGRRGGGAALRPWERRAAGGRSGTTLTGGSRPSVRG
jgi:hypothetical protein